MHVIEVWQPAAGWTPLVTGHLDVWRVPLVERPGDRDVLELGELERADRLVVPEKGRQWTAARAALRRILGRYLGVTPAEIRFAYGAQGKPALASPAGPAFNLSHSGQLALVAVALHEPLGIDIEHCEKERPFARLTERFFAAGEAAEILSLPDQERVAAFYRGWTRKEAYVKAWGTGLTFSSRRFVVTLGEDETPRLLATEMPGDDPARWHWLDLVPAPGYRAAVCWRDEELEPRLFALG